MSSLTYFCSKFTTLTFLNDRLTTHLLAINRPLEAQTSILDFFSRAAAPSLSSKLDQFGVLIEEVKRPNPFHYTAFELEALFYLFDLATSIQKYDRLANSVPFSSFETIKKAVDFAILYYLRSTMKNNPPLPPSVPREIESGSDLRSILFQTRSIAIRAGRDKYEWFVGKGGDGEMEPIKGIEFCPTEYFRGWTVSARFRWAMLEGY